MIVIEIRAGKERRPRSEAPKTSYGGPRVSSRKFLKFRFANLCILGHTEAVFFVSC